MIFGLLKLVATRDIPVIVDMSRALFVQGSDEKQLSHQRASQVMSLSFPVGSTSIEDKYSKLPETFQVPSPRKMMINSSTRQASPLNSNVGSSGQLFTSSSRFPSDAPLSSASPHERRPLNSPLISQSSGGMPPILPSLSEVQSATFIDHIEENKDISWCSESIQDLLDFPGIVSVQNEQVGNSVVTSQDHNEKTDWQDWPMISISDDLDHYWPDFTVSDNTTDSKPEVSTYSL